MAKARNKKYVPRGVKYPQIINVMTAFDSIGKVLNDLLHNGEVLQGNDGKWYVRDIAGRALPMEDEIESYILFIGIVNRSIEPKIDVSDFEAFYDTVKNNKTFTSSEIINLQQALENCKPVFSKLPAKFIHLAFKEISAKRPYVQPTLNVPVF